ncbi:unnamed protein product [Acanthoscelides obtectus]|uniref:C2H2-type domain-containing protein n=1 Tax=Acanthoscelides obtectus TaxID=200917 RepID=A0A9P0K157_ACAOB|nr:unnamed protein product [Acanthoscelides obtectus]CAK1669628.1 Zinc finger protein 155 [Acanthoscelides obtectus]
MWTTTHVFKNDGMPQLICNTCRNLTQQAYIFKTNCKKADEALKLFLATGQLSKPYLQRVEQLMLPPEPQPILIGQHPYVETPKEPPPQPKIRTIKQIKMEAGEVITVDVTEDENLQLVEEGQHESEGIFGLGDDVEQEADNSIDETESGEVPTTKMDIPNQLSCVRCDKEFMSQETLDAHLKRHMKQRPFTCDICNKSFVFRQGLERHNLTHAANNSHRCNYCDSSFRTSIALARHITQHEGLRPYACKICNRTFVQSHHVSRHMRVHFAVKSAKPDNVVNTYKCDLCSMSFRRKDYLINHSAIHSMVNLRCVICNTEFETAAQVKEHITTHLAGLPFPCQRCDYSFETEEQLELHELKHAEMMYEDQIEREVITEAIEKGEMTFGNVAADEETPVVENFPKKQLRVSNKKRRIGANSGSLEVLRTYGDRRNTEMEEEGEESEVQEYTIVNLDNPAPDVDEADGSTEPANDFLKDEIDAEFEANEPVQKIEPEEIESENTERLKPIIRQEGTKVYTRKFAPQKRPHNVKNFAQIQQQQQQQPMDTITIDDDNATANVIEDATPVEERLPPSLNQLRSEPVYEKKAKLKSMGGKVVKVQKFIITKEEMKAMAKQGILELKDGKVVLKNAPQPILNASLKPVEKNEINWFLEKKKEAGQLKRYQKKISDGEKPEHDIWR